MWISTSTVKPITDTNHPAARPPARLAQPTLRFYSSVLYRGELPNPGICAIILV
jgi:hypothetical protein